LEWSEDTTYMKEGCLSFPGLWIAIKRAKSVAVKFQVFDSSLDTDGTDAFLKIINTLDADTNVFVISHKGEILFDKFISTIKFVKEKSFSKIEAG